MKEEWEPQARKGRNLFRSVLPWLVDNARGIILGMCGNLQLVLATQCPISMFLWCTEIQYLTSNSRHWWYFFQSRGGLWSCRGPLTAKCQQPGKHPVGFVQVLGLMLPWNELAWAGEGEPSSCSHNNLKVGGDWRLKNHGNPQNWGWAADEERLYILAALSILLLSGFAGQRSHPTDTLSCLQPPCVCWEDFQSDFCRKWGIYNQPNFFSLCLSLVIL